MTAIGEILRTMDYGPAPEANDRVTAWLAAHEAGFAHFVDGAFSAPGNTRLDVYDPAHGTLLARVAHGTPADVDAAVAAARRAHPAWSARAGHERARYLYALARQVQKHERFLAVLESMNSGKPIRESRDIDVPLVARHFTHHAGWAELSATEFPGTRSLGVCGAIIPWNFPLLMLAWKIAPALAAGNTVVLKPAEFTPLTALAFAQLCRAVGLPPGVVNVVCGDGATGAALAAHRGVDKIAFTGSTDVGREIRRATAGSGKKLSLELGGKSPFIVFDDADLDSAVEGVVDAVWFNQGEVCCAGSRLLVHEGIADRFHAKLKRRMERLRVGDPLDKSTDIGAIVAPVQLARITELVETGRREGGTVWTPAAALPTAGWFYPPTLISDVAPASTVAEIEIFGPVAVSLTFRTPAEAIALANNTRYGLAASVWSENINVALDVAAAVKAGVVWVNATNLFDAAAGFGGYKESGFGREGGREGMGGYLTTEAPAAPAAMGDYLMAEASSAPPVEMGEYLAADVPAAPPVRSRNGAGAASGDAPKHRGDATPALGEPPAPNGAWAGAGADAAPDATLTEDAPTADAARGGTAPDDVPAIDRTAKLYIGGKQVRPDGGYSYSVYAAAGGLTGQAPLGNRKDIRNAVEAAAKATAWSTATAHNRAQVLYFVAENLAARAAEFADRIAAATGAGSLAAVREVERAIERTFWYAAWADKFDGRIHATKTRQVTLAVHEPWGVMGVVCPSAAPLLAFVSLVMPAIALGNRVVVVPSQTQPLVATDLYQVFDTSDVPAGVINIVTGERDALAAVLAEHHDVAAVWYHGPAIEAIERGSASNLKPTWVQPDGAIDWYCGARGQGRQYLEHAVQTKNIWIPYGA